MPVLIGAIIILMMVTWMRGRQALAAKLRKESIELVGLLESLEKRPPTRVAGAAVFLQTDPVYAPSALMHNLKHNRVLHDILVFITRRDDRRAARRARRPRHASSSCRSAPGWSRPASATWSSPMCRRRLRACEPFGLAIDPRQASYFLGRRVIRTSARSALPFWQQRLFIMLANQSARAIEFFRIPPDRVVELGMQMSV